MADPRPGDNESAGGGITAYALVLFAGALLHGLTLWIFHAKFPFVDQPIRDAAFWDAAARALTAGGDPFYRAPGYAVFVRMIRGPGGSAPLAVAIGQAVLVFLATFLVMRAAHRMFGFREAILTGAMIVGSGVVYLFEARLLPEALALFLAAVVVQALVAAERGQPVPADRGEKRARDRALADGAPAVPLPGAARFQTILAGVAAGLLAITRAEYLGAALLIAVVFLARAGRRTRPWALGLLFAAGSLVIILPVTVYNVSRGAGTPVATSGGVALYRGNAKGADPVPEPVAAGTGAIFSGYWLLEKAEASSVVAADLGAGLAPGRAWGYWISRAAREIAADPAAWLDLTARKVRVLIGRPVESHNLAYGLELDRIPILRVASVPFNFLALAGILGLVLAGAGARRTARASRLPSVSLLVAAAASGVLFFPEADVRVPVIPILAIFSAHTLVRADLAWRAGRRRAVLIAAAAGLVVLGFTSIPRSPLRNPIREARLFVEAGTGLGAAGKTADAVDAFREALSLDSSNAEALVHLGQVALLNTELAEAVGWFEKAAAAAPDDFSIRNNLGILYYQAQRFEVADREMEAAAHLLPGDPGPWFYRGQCHRKLGDPAAAEEFFREAISLDSRYVGAYVRLIELLLEQGRDADARQWADRAGVNGVAMPKEIAERLR